MTTLAFIDTETTGLDPERHEVWEAALVLVEFDGSYGDRTEQQHVWQLAVDPGAADPAALSVGRFYERVKVDVDSGVWFPGATLRCEFAWKFAKATHGATLVGSNPSFDAAFLSRLLRANGACPGWHYRTIDVATLAAGWLAGVAGSNVEGVTRDTLAAPWKSDDLSRAVGVDPEQFERHTALGDALWAKAVYEAVMA